MEQENIPVRKLAQQVMEGFTIEDKIYQGKVDVTEHIKFSEIAEEYKLTPEQYELLIEYCEEITSTELTKYLALQFVEKQKNRITQAAN